MKLNKKMRIYLVQIMDKEKESKKKRCRNKKVFKEEEVIVAITLVFSLL
jgi:hypothetical protein